jgi:hypothetical protein
VHNERQGSSLWRTAKRFIFNEKHQSEDKYPSMLDPRWGRGKQKKGEKSSDYYLREELIPDVSQQPTSTGRCYARRPEQDLFLVLFANRLSNAQTCFLFAF